MLAPKLELITVVDCNHLKDLPDGGLLQPSRGLDDNVIMAKTLEAIYENGLLRPLERLYLKEHQQVTVTISDALDPWIDHEYLEQVRKEVAAMGPAPTREEVRQALSKIPGNLSDDIRAERDCG